MLLSRVKTEVHATPMGQRTRAPARLVTTAANANTPVRVLLHLDLFIVLAHIGHNTITSLYSM